eukprot:gene9803-7693_t
MLSVPKQLRASPRHGAARVQVAPKLVRPQRTRAFLASVKATSDKQCVIWELDGGVVDLCIDFTVPLYNDLLSAGDGTAEGLLTAYFKTVGWPEMLPTADQPLFLMKPNSFLRSSLTAVSQPHSLLRSNISVAALFSDSAFQQLHSSQLRIVEKKESELAKLFKKDKVPLRDSVDRVINDALAAGTKVVFIAGTLSQTANDVTSTAETNKTKAAAANNFAQVLKDAQNSGDALAVDVDNNLLAAGNRRTVTPELLSAICATTDVAMSNCVLIGASSSVTSAAIQAGMTAVAIPRRMAAQLQMKILGSYALMIALAAAVALLSAMPAEAEHLRHLGSHVGHLIV